MFNIIKICLLFLGCVVVYGLVVGADLSTLFSSVTDTIMSSITDFVSGVIRFFDF